MNNKIFQTLTVSADHSNSRLDRFIKRQVPDLTQGQVEKMARKGLLRLNQKKAVPSDRVQEGDEVSYKLLMLSGDAPPKAVKKSQPFQWTRENEEFFNSMILWEDDDWIALNKPHGLAVQGGSKTTEHIDGMLQARGEKEGRTYRLVHRLDKDTSGVLVVAKTLAMAKHLSNQFKMKEMDKIYWAITIGHMDPAMGMMKFALSKEKVGGQEKMIVDPKQGKPSVTQYHSLKRLVGRKNGQPLELTWVELHPQTGRTHQLRAHCQALGNPILGDLKYGNNPQLNREFHLHLHARSLTLNDLSGHPFTFVAPPPLHIEDTLFACGVKKID